MGNKGEKTAVSLGAVRHTHTQVYLNKIIEKINHTNDKIKGLKY